MTIELKTFQKNTLAVLAKYLEQARLTDDPQEAFLAVARDPHGRVPLYRRVPGLEAVPYVCLRLPTGGGKTIVAAHAIRTAARSYIEKEFPVVLWLVPTNTIRLQTADALKNTAHSYRQALDDAFEGRVGRFRHRRHRQPPARRPERPRLRHRRHHPDPARRKDRGPRRLRAQRGAGKPLHPAEHGPARPGAVRRRPKRRAGANTPSPTC